MALNTLFKIKKTNDEQTRTRTKKSTHLHHSLWSFGHCLMGANKRIPTKNMRYLVTEMDGFSPFLTNVYDYENNWDDRIGMVIYDLQNLTYTTDGKTWMPIEIDQL